MCIRDENGVPVRMAGAHSDITERKRAEENLRASEKRLAQIIDFMPDATLVIDNNGRVIAWNQAIERLTGVRTEEMLGKGNFDYAVPFYGKRRPMLADLALRPRTYIHNAYESFQWNGDSITAEATITTPDGPQHIWGTATVLFDASGRAIGAIECIRDITELKNYQINLQRAKDNAEAANTAKSEFLANMSHEIRTPLNGVLGMLQLLQTTDLDKEQSNFVHTATFSGKSLLSVINDILDFSKIEAGKIELSNEPFSPANLVRTITETFALQASEKGIQLEHMVTKNVPDTVLGDNGRIRQVLFNLIGNAVKFTHEGRVGIVLDAETEDPENVRLLLTVADTGVGIDKQKLPNIFKPFTQADGSLARKYQGTGLGLSIVKRLVALMQGHIEIESEPGKGTRVKLDLLADAAATTRISETGRDAAASAGGNGAFRILVAEDNPVSQIFTIKILEKLGHQVTLVDNGNDVLAMLAGETFDLVLMDIQMPGMDGMEATRKIRNGDSGVLDSTVPIVAMTAHAMQGDREKFILTGMNDYVSKPLAVEELERIIRDTAARGKENPGG
jgi:PAS domain S-box-containing protein